MAKDNRFPSPANQNKRTHVVANTEEPKSAPVVEGKKQNLVQLEYKLENNHFLNPVSNVHSLAKGINHIPAHIWKAAKDHPATKKLMADGHLVVVGEQSEAKVGE